MDFILQIWQNPLLQQAFWMVFYIVVVLLGVTLSVAYLTLIERRVIGRMQLRIGPNRVGPFGLLQPFADVFKMLFKEAFVPSGANRWIFILAPMMIMVPAFAAWAVIPFGEGVVISDINLGLMYLLAISSLSVYGILMAGWASNSKYAFLGAVRSAAQMVSYEVSMGLTVLSVVLMSGSMNLTAIVQSQQGLWYIVPAFPMFVVFVISALAETNRAPFDLPEAEAEIVAGYNVEYSGTGFALFMLGEYASMIMMSALTSILFLGGWLPPVEAVPFTLIPGFVWLALKTAAILFIFLWTRATLPRFRYDQLMRLGWKVFLPFTLLWLVLTATALKLFALYGA